MFKFQITKKNIKENLQEYLLYLFVFLLPWQIRWIIRDFYLQGEVFEYGRISLYAFDIVFAVLLVYYIVILFKRKLETSPPSSSVNTSQIVRADRPKGENQKLGKIFFVFLFFCFFVFLSVFWADEKLISLYWGIRMLAGFGLFWLMQKINFSKVRLAVTVVIAGAIQGLLGIWQFINQNVWQAKWLGMAGQRAMDLGTSVIEFGLERWLRAYGSLPHPNILGGFLVLAMIAMVYLILRIEDKYQKLFILFSCSFIWLGIFFSFSRAAWLGLILVNIIGTWIIIKKGDGYAKKFTKWLWIYGSLLFLVFIIATLPIVKTRLNIGAPNRLEMKSKIERIEGYKQAGEIIKGSWLAGAGIGNYSFELQKKYSEMMVWDSQPVHNVPLLILAELGILGMLIVMLLNCYIIKLLIKRKKWSYLCLLLIVYCLLFFDHFWWTLGSGLYVLWMVIGLAVKEIDWERN